MDRAVLIQNVKGLSQGNLGVPLLLLVILAMVTLPMPPFLLDVLFTFNIALSIVVLLVGVYALRPLDFAVFPTILLVATLMRLALNVASTRVVLLYGHEGGDAAGKVIEAFGSVVIGGNYVVGIVVFLILVIINFVVVTKGAGRISEVSARFTLDAMPGKQMAIDADLNAGLINQDEAKARRQDVTQEADFYGAMDGASKFVRGDAVAGILILVINILGGLLIGMLQHDLSFELAAEYYSLLTIGDGLVAQIPSLLLSTAAAIMVTRQNSSQDMGSQIVSQMFSSVKALVVAAVILFIMGIVPGMPHFAFLSLAALAGGGAWWITKRQQQRDAEESERLQTAETTEAEAQEDLKELDWDDVMPVDMIGLEVGYRLIPMVDKLQGGQLLNRIKGVRKKLSQDLGFLVPSVHIRDNLDLMPGAYRITLMGVVSGEAEIYPDRDLAINPGQVFGELKGIEVQDPAFGLSAVWIEQGQREHAQTLGYTVVDASTVVATHLNQILQSQAHQLLGHEEVQQLLDMLAKSSPKLVEELVPAKLSISALLKILQSLLLEQVPLKDFRSIAEALSDAVNRTQDPVALTAAVRVAIAKLIVQSINGAELEIPVITLDPQLEQLLLNSVQQSQQAGEEGMVLEPGMAERLQNSLVTAAQGQEMQGLPSILLVAAPVRPLMARFVRYSEQLIHVLSYQEVPENKKITIVATVGGQNA